MWVSVGSFAKTLQTAYRKINSSRLHYTIPGLMAKHKDLVPFPQGFYIFARFLSQPGGGVINVLVLEILPYDFLLDNETENTHFNN